ncbi:hypothetical protein OG885_00210 [Streptomyces sp. NBC_00028]|uniref:hypothetical protein n=1 Tax=Streptomyces sp. NBC_00028 TaxID=2975624 RepID=UPI00324A1915
MLEPEKDRFSLTIERLKYCDAGCDSEAIAGLFTADGRWVVDGEGASLNSREEIRKHFAR